MYIIGITGGTGAGKTTALSVLRRRGAFVLDCDALYHELLRTSDRMKAELRARFPAAWRDGEIDRAVLRDIVFPDERELKALNEITHRHVSEAVLAAISAEKRAGRTVVAIDAIELIESGLGALCDVTIFVKASPEARRRRIMLRDNIGADHAEARISIQKNDEYFERNCDITLVNDSDTAADFEKKCECFFDMLIGGLDHERNEG